MATETDTLPLIRTKLYRPRITGDLVPRPRLLERLEQRRDRPLTLVVAPAGYGKTTLVASWLATCDCPSAWLSLDEDDNDFALFLSYFSAAVQTMFPDALEETSALLQAAILPPLDVLARSLINELDQDRTALHPGSGRLSCRPEHGRAPSANRAVAPSTPCAAPGAGLAE